MRKTTVLPLLITLLLLLAACAGEEEPTPTLAVTAPPAQAPTQTPEPTAEPTSAPTPTEPATPTPTPTPAALEITTDILANMEYQSEFTASGTAPLVDGQYSEPAAPGSATETKVSLTEHVAFGELNGQPAAAVILVNDPGGSGTFYDLAVVIEQDGQPVNVATTLLGDRVQVDALSIEDGQIVVDMVTQGPEDAMCCPTQQVVNSYALQGDQLVESSSELVGTVEPSVVVEAAPIQDVTWFWLAFQDMAEINDLTVADPGNYTLTLLPDGTADIQADCNQLQWSYTLEGSSLAFNTLGPSTLAFCGEESLDQQYLALLGDVVTFVTQEDQLFLNLKMDAGNMVFGVTAEAGAEDGDGDGDAETTDELPPDFIQLDVAGLAKTFEWRVVDASPIPPGPGGQGFPQHIVLGFDGEDPLEVPYSERRIMYVFPVEAYADLYQANGSDVVAAQVARLEELIATAEDRLGSPEGIMPLLPPPNSLMDRWVQFADLEFVDGQGVRYVSDSPLRQSIGVWTNGSTDYYYQGLTEDGRFYISFKWPVATSSLPNTVEDASEELKQQASSSRESYEQYLAATKAELNALGPSAWSPDLSALDAMIASLSFRR